jgi:transglutaminase-like putative cysteine protease
MNGEEARTATAAAAATLLGACALRPVFSSAAWLPPVLAVVVVVLAGGLLLRTGGPTLWAAAFRGRPVPHWLGGVAVTLVPLAQLTLLACLLTALYAPAGAIAGLIPTADSLADFAAVLADGSAEMREQATPALPLTGLLALTTLFVGLVAVMVDLVAVAGRQAALAGLGLLVLYCVPVTTVTGGIGLLAIAGPAAGLAVLLWADQHRRLAASARAGQARLGAGTPAALRIGGGALAAGLVLGAVLPTLTEGSFGTGLGGGSGNATGRSLDPFAELQGQLTLSEPIDLLRVDASVEDPGYLRAVALDEYDVVNGWTLSNLGGQTSIADDVRLAPLPSEGSRQVRASIRAIGHDDRFLPVLYSPLSVQMDAGGEEDWRFDASTATVYGRDVRTAGRSYRVTASQPRPGPGVLARSAPLLPGNLIQDRFTALPDLDPQITDLVAELTDGAPTPYQRVRRIHDYLSDRDNGFIYSLSTAPGTSGDDLVDFLRLKRGYCEQYAGAMAVLVRAAGVPARVALGYTPGTVQRDGSRMITSDDAHAWVEVYLESFGWVPFDPTPIAADRAVQLAWAPRADRAAGDDSVAAPGPAVPTRAGPTPRTDRAAGPVPTQQLQQDDAIPVGRLLAWSGTGLLAVGAVLGPAAVRVVHRRRRLAEGSAGALWDELTATARDLGLRLNPAWTPRQTARELTAAMSVPWAPAGPDAPGEAVLRLAVAEETASYGRPLPRPAHPDLPGVLVTARRSLVEAQPRSTRWRARLWPASMMTGALPRLVGRLRRRLGAPVRRWADRRARTV